MIHIYFMHPRAISMFSVILLCICTTTANQSIVVGGDATNKCIDKERDALLDIKAHLQDPEGCLATWRPDDKDCCKWDGVKCDNPLGHVSELWITIIDPEGEISPSLLNLSYLTYLDLTAIAVEANIIRKLMGSMTKLTYLDLSGNEFTGTNILDYVGNMTQLTYLDLHWNQFRGTIPESIGSLINLTHLDLSKNNFSGSIPMSIGSLTKLTNLDLSENNFSGIIPGSIGSLTELTQLSFSMNSFSGTIPRSIGYLTKLMYLSLSENPLYGTIPLEFGNLTDLEELTLDGISLGRANYWVDIVIGLKKLITLSLRGCDLSQVTHPYSSSVNFSSSILKLSLDNNNLNSSMYCWLCPLVGDRLVYLSIGGNKLDGELSDFLNNLAECASVTLNFLDASSNQFSGSLSNDIQKFSFLYHLNLAFNRLNGTISDKLWEQPALRELDLSSNSLKKGTIFENIGKSHLSRINLSNNSLDGLAFDADMSNLSQTVEYIDFSSCNLGPRFPEWIQSLKRLTHLSLANNNISDMISMEYWNHWRLCPLFYLDLSFNNISGKLPESLSTFYLSTLDLSSNNFYGPIPTFSQDIKFIDLSRNKFYGGVSFLCRNYKNLEFLDLSRNSLRGQLSDCWRNLTKLTVLNLGHNFLSGRLPSSLGYLGQVELMYLYNNSFSGELPAALQNCTKLSLLDLGANSFCGIVPAWIGESLSGLYYLSLRLNNFSGTIPLQLCQLASLQILDLSMNNLDGTIPWCVKNFTTMVQKGFFVKQKIHHYYESRYFSAGRGSAVGYSYKIEDDNSYVDQVMLEWQGKINEFSSILGLVKTIDLSSNNLTGKIPHELTNLYGLLVLDLSHNALVGEIPEDISQMTQLLTLNLSRNMFSGVIPSTMSQMVLLNDLDVSYNNLSGRVPSSTQLQSFPPERFIENEELCGPPLTKYCPGDKEPEATHVVGETEGDEKDKDELWRWFYIGGGTGFATAFWIACSTLFLNRRIRHAFFHFHDSLKDWVCVKVIVFAAKLQRGAHA